MADLHTFVAGTGISAPKLNQNFENLKSQSNDNEIRLTELSNVALLKDGTNVTQSLVSRFNERNIIEMSGQGDISLPDNSEIVLTLEDNGVIRLPQIEQNDAVSHTIALVVMGSEYSLDVSTATNNKHLLNNFNVDASKPFSVLFIYNKIDNSWYYYLAQ